MGWAGTAAHSLNVNMKEDPSELEINLYFVSLGSFSHVVYEPNRGKDQAGINNSTLSLLKLNSESSRDLKMPWTKTEKS